MKKTLFFILIVVSFSHLLPLYAQETQPESKPEKKLKLIPGKIISLKDGNVLEMGIQKIWLKRQGKILAKNIKTEEIFSGDYMAFVENKSGAIVGTTFSQNGSSNFVAPTNQHSNLAQAQATLLGDKQTILQCNFTIQGGFSPHGMGNCEDNKGEKYSLQF